jgi:hypothetical protein
MKHAYLILAHNDIPMLDVLVNCIAEMIFTFIGMPSQDQFLHLGRSSPGFISWKTGLK